MAEKLLEYHLKLIERNNFNPITNFDNYSFVTQEKTLNSVPILSQNTQILKPIIERNTSEEKTGQKNKDKLKEDKEFVIPIETIEGFNVVLIVDNREVKAQDDRSYIHQKLIENGLNCEMGTLPLGDFLWIARIKG